MNLKKLNKQELINLKSEIDKEIKEINEFEKNKKLLKSQEFKKKTKLSHLNHKDKIFCVDFKKKIHNYDYVDISIYDEKDGYVKYSTSHKTKPFGVSSSFETKYLDKHYFLDIFCCDSMYFFTLKPKDFKKDLKLAFAEYEKTVKENHLNELKKSRQYIKDFIKEFELKNIKNHV